jgi:outer membrane protein assembly factor BamB
MKTTIQIFLAILFCMNVTGQEIAQWRGENRNGIYNETGLLKKWPENGPKLLWHFDELGDGHASAAVTNSVIVTAGMIGDKGYIYAFDHSGKLLWKTEYGTEWIENWNGVRSTPLIYQDKVYMLSAFEKLVCLSLKTGVIEWNTDIMATYGGRNITWGVTENLLIVDNNLIVTVGGSENSIVALDRITGKLAWKSKGNGEKSAYCSPLLINMVNRKILVTMMEKSILAIDASNGNVLWTHEQTNEWAVHPNIPVYKDGYLYCVSGYGRGGVMLKLSDDGGSASEVWRNSSLDNRMGGVVVINDRIYGTGDKSRKFICLDWKTGKEVYSLNQLAPGNIISAEGLLYVYAESGTIGLVEPKSDAFSVLSTFKVPFGSNQHWAHLVIKDKKLYVRHGTSLMVYDIKEN